MQVKGSIFTVDRHYELIKPIGSGAYGVVISARDTRLNEKIAVNRIPRAFDSKDSALRVLREVRLLRHFSDHQNIVSLIHLQQPPSLDDLVDVYIFTDLMETDLHRVIYSGLVRCVVLVWAFSSNPCS